MSLRDGLLLGLGNPLLDISAAVDAEFLKKYDLKRDDAILAEPKHDNLYKELAAMENVEYFAGGSVQNSCRVAQWIMQKPNVAVYFGCVGKDEFSKILENRARTAGVNVQYQYDSKAATGTCAVCITGTHRSLCANLGAANNFTVDHLEIAENKKYFENAKFFYTSGFFLTASPPSIMATAKHALENKRPFIMNLSAPFISQFYKEPLMEALPYVDILFGNETEASTFAREQCWPDDSLVDIGKNIINLPKHNKETDRIVIFTQGCEPVLLIEKDKVTQFNVEKLSREQIVDTNGAGDAFTGGFLSQYVQEKNIDVCIRCGIWAASKIIQRSGCTFEGIPDFREQ